ncbi:MULTISPECIES: Ig-like domain-containing protein [unclassified Ruminococcus]|uniref:Ig-like domain-containing protein n=1 Tax=unclassified Ruminococcus TaxID=2608920 RepID=UPI00210AFD46|nr:MULTISPECIES: Ig-like domain-containing protein [unclassified Ruminococcus]MCQ4022131.1 CHAP domain-containing protein [Ruminococcus sp. zg-924]MCQ4114451.1 CHAP domain-containing protein [Ruminococcus sp. zg-921]
MSSSKKSVKNVISLLLICTMLLFVVSTGAVNGKAVEADNQDYSSSEDATKELVLGDANSDKTVQLIDAIIIQKYSLSVVKFNNAQLICANVNKDNGVNLLDSILVQKYTLQMLSEDLGIGTTIVNTNPTEDTTTPATETDPITDITVPTTETDPTTDITVPTTETDPITDTTTPTTETDPITDTTTPTTETDPITDTTTPATETDPITDTTTPATETDPITDTTTPTTETNPTEATTPTTETDPTEATEPDEVSLNKEYVTLGVNEQFTLIKSTSNGTDLSDAVFSSSDTAVAVVDKMSGTVTAVSTGKAIIKITTHNGAEASCKVTVKKAPTDIALNKTSVTLGIGETFDLNSSLPTGEGAYSILYSSNNSAVASVNAAGGLVTAKAVGSASITATTYNGKKVTCEITVKNAPTYISLNKVILTLRVGEFFDLNSLLPKGEGAYDITYSSGNSIVASVKAAGGLVYAVSPGTAKITVKTYNGVFAVCSVVVEKIPNNIQSFLDRALAYQGYGYSHFISVMAPYGACPGDAWCAWFVSTVSKESGLSNIIPISGGAGSIPRIGVARGAGTWYEGYNSIPRAGDIIVFTWNQLGYYPGQDQYFSDHVGIVYKVDNEYVYTVEGNTTANSPVEGKPIKDDPTVTNTNTKVYCRKFKLYSKFINGYYRPNY